MSCAYSLGCKLLGCNDNVTTTANRCCGVVLSIVQLHLRVMSPFLLVMKHVLSWWHPLEIPHPWEKLIRQLIHHHLMHECPHFTADLLLIERMRPEVVYCVMYPSLKCVNIEHDDWYFSPGVRLSVVLRHGTLRNISRIVSTNLMEFWGCIKDLGVRVQTHEYPAVLLATVVFRGMYSCWKKRLAAFQYQTNFHV